MKKRFVLFLLVLIVSNKLHSQIDSLKPNDDLLNEITQTDSSTIQLLPDHFLFTQRIFWGHNGLMRHFTYFKLTPENRQRELKLRRTMLIAHQTLGFVTLGGMIAQGIVGSMLYNGNENVRDLHEGLAGGINFGYFTTAALSLFAPPKMLNERKGYSSIKVHKILAMVHLSAMITTNILAGMLEGNPEIKPYHRAAAFTAFAAFTASMIIIKF